MKGKETPAGKSGAVRRTVWLGLLLGATLAGAGYVHYGHLLPFGGPGAAAPQETPLPPDPMWRPTKALVVDLDGGGLATVGLAAQILFDHGDDGIAENTGWPAAGDAFLVRDLDGDQHISSGRELFGSATRLQGGGLAANGIEALAELDRNRDGQVTADDDLFGQLGLWRDANQDGVTDPGELRSLDEAGISALSLKVSQENAAQGDGNIRRGTAEAVRADGLRLATGLFDFETTLALRKFRQAVPVPEQLRDLPNLRVSGTVRDLREAAALDPELAAMLRKFVDSDYAGQRNLIDAMALRWTQTSRQALVPQPDRDSVLVEYLWSTDPKAGIAPDAPRADLRLATGEVLRDAPLYWLDAAFTPEQRRLQQRFRANEYVNGKAVRCPLRGYHHIVAAEGLPAGVSLPAGGVYLVEVCLTPRGMQQVDSSWQAWTDMIYEKLANASRLKPYVNQEQQKWSVRADGQLEVDFSALQATFDHLSRPPLDIEGLTDFIEVFRQRHALWQRFGWNGEELLRRWVGAALVNASPEAAAPADRSRAALLARLAQLGVVGPGLPTARAEALIALGGVGSERFAGGALPDHMMGGDGNDTLLGNGGEDVLLGGGGADTLQGGAGDDLLVGGRGDDELEGGAGRDTYGYGRGDGRDAIRAALDPAGHSFVQLRDDLSPADVTVSRLGDDLLLGMPDGGQLRIREFFAGRPLTVVFRSDPRQWDPTELTARVGGPRGSGTDGFSPAPAPGF